MGSSRQESWGGLLWPPPGHLPNPGIEPASLRSPALTGGFFTTSFTGEALCSYNLAGIDRSYFIQPWEFLSEMFLLMRYIKGVYKSLFSIRPVTSPKRTDGYCFFFSIHNIPLYGYSGVYSSRVLHGRLGCLRLVINNAPVNSLIHPWLPVRGKQPGGQSGRVVCLWLRTATGWCSLGLGVKSPHVCLLSAYERPWFPLALVSSMRWDVFIFASQINKKW